MGRHEAQGEDDGGHNGCEHPTAGDHDAARANSNCDTHKHLLLQQLGLVGLPSGFISNSTTVGGGQDETEAERRVGSPERR
jgi:hypothetical protein